MYRQLKLFVPVVSVMRSPFQLDLRREGNSACTGFLGRHSASTPKRINEPSRRFRSIPSGALGHLARRWRWWGSWWRRGLGHELHAGNLIPSLAASPLQNVVQDPPTTVALLVLDLYLFLLLLLLLLLLLNMKLKLQSELKCFAIPNREPGPLASFSTHHDTGQRGRIGIQGFGRRNRNLMRMATLSPIRQARRGHRCAPTDCCSPVMFAWPGLSLPTWQSAAQMAWNAS